MTSYSTTQSMNQKLPQMLWHNLSEQEQLTCQGGLCSSLTVKPTQSRDIPDGGSNFGLVDSEGDFGLLSSLKPSITH